VLTNCNVGSQSAATATRPTGKIDLLSLIDRNNPEQQAIAFAILRARQKRKAEEARKRGHRG
jgi:hypothetical protein